MTYRPHLILALLASAGVHAALVPEHMEEAPVLGWLFVASATAAILLAVWLGLRPSRRAMLATGATLAVFVVAYLETRVAGLTLVGIPHEAPENLGLATIGMELAGVAFALNASRRETARAASSG